MSSNPTILVVEDDQSLRDALCDTLEMHDYQVVVADSAEAAVPLLARHAIALTVSDVRMPGKSGYELLDELRRDFPQVPVVLMTAYGDVANAVEAMQKGAVDYLVKPFRPQQLLDVLDRHLGSRITQDASAPVASDPSSQHVLELARKVAPTDSTIMISGESGTGKEVLARYVHQHSNRAGKPFVAINCAAIPENMLEATLFGHEKGAFTGAIQSLPGKFEQAEGGTLLLDEISEMDLGLQAKLLRVLQEREVERIGGRKTIQLDVRVLATTNRDLRQCVQAGSFREDLFYRLSVFPLQWRPLRERSADIIPLAERLIGLHADRMHKAPVQLDESARMALLRHPWPGNIREMDNAIQRALILQQGQVITEYDLGLSGEHLIDQDTRATEPSQNLASDNMLTAGVKQHEYQLIVDALRAARGRKKQAAENLGISPRTLRYKMARLREMGVDVDAAMA
ncbi:sigma-54-dependent Fis family transcriptional regulator [Natronospirillum operosum]|uniref:Sigma-54-dependent Fis family transcriptional regulator n=1 Tax=Natronospirillum operosum TaxID=2759953 RepID=A0A4Z0WCP4_9GAMM|nr:sigma-54 dependent transcriptional regulator [Natronospirillum operosum]TGG95982.1 sigma-54-dependent Fis family transcriptional regulator [Natronospirillum operosum]